MNNFSSTSDLVGEDAEVIIHPDGYYIDAFEKLIGQPVAADAAGNLPYSTYIGGTGLEDAEGIAIDNSGCAYFVGTTSSSNFPTTPGAYNTTHGGGDDAYVCKINAAGTALVYSTFLGGTSNDFGYGIVVDDLGYAYALGFTSSVDFPTTSGAFNETINGIGSDDVFVVKLSPDGSTLEYSTFIGGSGDDYAENLALDSSGNIFITGYTPSSDFPTTVGVINNTYNGGSYDIFVCKLNNLGSALIYSTLLGGLLIDRGHSIAIDSSGNAYITGVTSSSTNFPTTTGAINTTFNGGTYDAFVSKINADGTVLVYSTLIGGSDSDSVYDIAVDESGCAYITGYGSSNFPTTTGVINSTDNGGYDVFVCKIGAGGTTLEYSTFLGGSGSDTGQGIAVDRNGCAFVTGYTTDSTTDFPTTPGALNETHNGGTNDVFMAKINAEGSVLDYSTFLGGSNQDYGYAIVVDSWGDVYIAGQSYSTNFPTTSNAFDEVYNGAGDIFVSKIDTNLTSEYATFFGGSGEDIGYGVAVGDEGCAYITGRAASSDFPTTPGVIGPSHTLSNDAFVCKMNAEGTALIYSTYLGGSALDTARAIAVDSSGNAYIVGQTQSANFPVSGSAMNMSNNGGFDLFVTKLNTDATALVYSTYLGGSSSDYGCAIAIDSAGNAYVTGRTASTDYPTTPGAIEETYQGGDTDAFLTKISADGSTAIYSTFLGGSATDNGYEYTAGIAVDSANCVYVTGHTGSTDFPTTPGAFQEVHAGSVDVFVAKIDATGSNLLYSTFIGGAGDDRGNALAIDDSGFVYVTGQEGSTNYPTTIGVISEQNQGNYDVFVTKLNVAGSGLEYSTLLGGWSADYGYAINIDESGNAYIAGTSNVNDVSIPTTAGAINEVPTPGTYNAIMFKINADATVLEYSTFLGGDNSDYGRAIAMNKSGTVYLAGSTSASSGLATPGALNETSNGGTDAIAFKIVPIALDDSNPIITHMPDDFTMELGYTAVIVSWAATDRYNYNYSIALEGVGNVVDPTSWTSGIPVTLAIPEGLSVGDHLFTMDFTDINKNNKTDYLTLTVEDTTNPISTMIPADVIVDLDYDFVRFKWTATDLDASTYTIELVGDQVVTGPTTWISGNEVEYVILSGLEAGEYTYKITFLDNSDNIIIDTVTLTINEGEGTGDEGGDSDGDGDDSSNNGPFAVIPGYPIVGLGMFSLIAVVLIGGKKKR